MMIRVLVPDLPNRAALAPYLERIDVSHCYTNGGPLVRELESRLGGGAAVASGTLGLELAARWAFCGRVRIPAFTFPATATALLRAGLEPVLCDVDEETWALDMIDAQSLPVAPFGAAVCARLADAAGAIGNAIRGNRVYSLHATKPLPAGEGGFVAGDPELVDFVRRCANFGLDDGRCITAGTNAKMSEYHAAAALASLDRWNDIRARREAMELRYRINLAGMVTMQKREPGVYPQFPVLVDDAQSAARKLLRRGIETRRWYLPTLERHPAFEHLDKESLPVCDMLNERCLCLPFHMMLSDAEIDYICDVLTDKRLAA